eukprot:gi/632962120/ref/XP_007897134.1/ PREDICTED: mucin-16-like [Callorhinchus milii]
MKVTPNPPLEEAFNVTFIITNLPFTPELENSGSQLYNSAANVIANRLDNIFNNSNISPAFSHCKVESLSRAKVDHTSVYALCTFKNNTEIGNVDKVIIYKKFSEKTNQISLLGTYTLDTNSLYVNGYHETTPFTTQGPTVKVTPNPPLEEAFNVTFIITNLPFTPELENSGSQLHNSAAKVIANRLDNIFNNSNISPAFSHCNVESFSRAKVDHTSVYALCTFKNNPEIGNVDKVIIYKKFSEKTNQISLLGTYTLDTNSLYVNDYHETTPLTTQGPTVKVTPNPPLEEAFNVTFIITNLPLTPELENSGSQLHNSAAKVIANRLDNIFNNSNISPAFSHCNVESFSRAKVDHTSVYALCTFKNNPEIGNVDKVIIYKKFSEKTNQISLLGTYTLDTNSLYVNGFHKEALPTEEPIVVVTQNPNQGAPTLQFNVTFIVTNLPFTSQLQNPDTVLYLSASAIIANRLDNLYNNSIINKTFSNCNVQSLSRANIDNTSVHAICTFKKDPTVQDVDRITVYKTFSEKTNHISALARYDLDSNSLYVNDYHESAALPTEAPIVTQNPDQELPTSTFNLTFIITNLPFTLYLQNSNSQLFRSASAIITNRLKHVFKGSPKFTGCTIRSLNRANVDNTSVEAICVFDKNPAVANLTKVMVYKMFKENTTQISILGTYSLDSNSLYVNDYHETTSSGGDPIVTPTPEPELPIFNVSFIIINLPFTRYLQNPNSQLHKSALAIITNRLDNVYHTSPEFSHCTIRSLSRANVDNTSVNGVCIFDKKPIAQQVTRDTVYEKFKQNTEQISTLGMYKLDSNSLYVNGYQQFKPTTQPPVTASVPLESFDLDFTISSRQFTEELANKDSRDYKSLETDIITSLAELFKQSALKDNFKYCEITGLSRGSVKVASKCFFTEKKINTPVNSGTVRTSFSKGTNGIKQLGKFQLKRNDLNVAPERSPLTFKMRFTIFNPLPARDTINTNNINTTLINDKLNNLYENSKFNETFINCNVTSLSSVDSERTTIESVCSFKNVSTDQEIDKVAVFREFKSNLNLNKLGPYQLSALSVEGYEEVTTTVTTVGLVSPTATVEFGDSRYKLEFTIINRNFVPELQDTNSAAYQQFVNQISITLTKLFKKSTLKDNYKICKVTGLRLGSIKVTCNCYFKPNETVSTVAIQNEFVAGTNSTTWLDGFQLKNDSLSVESQTPDLNSSSRLPYWAIIVIALACVFAVFLLFLLGYVITLCTRSKIQGSYNIMQTPIGVYFPHMNWRKLF